MIHGKPAGREPRETEIDSMTRAVQLRRAQRCATTTPASRGVDAFDGESVLSELMQAHQDRVRRARAGEAAAAIELVSRFASTYEVNGRIRQASPACNMVRLKPCDPAKLTLFLFRGTSPGTDRDVLTLTDDTGVATDFYTREIAYGDLQPHNETHLLTWVAEAGGTPCSSGTASALTGHCAPRRCCQRHFSKTGAMSWAFARPAWQFNRPIVARCRHGACA